MIYHLLKYKILRKEDEVNNLISNQGIIKNINQQNEEKNSEFGFHNEKDVVESLNYSEKNEY